MDDDDHVNTTNQTKESLNNLTKIFKKPEPTKFDYMHNLVKLLKQNEQVGNLQPYQSKMIDNVLNLQYITASDIMTHRIDIVAVEKNSTISDILNISTKNGISRVPIFKKNIDSIIGAIFVKDLLKLANKPNFVNQPITPLIRNLLYIPKTIKFIDLFLKLTKSHNHLAVVVDDFGGTSGIVTMEDIIETVFGQIQDEFDNEAEEIKKINNKTYIIQGLVTLKLAFTALNLELDPELNYENLSGFLIDLMGHIPEQNEQPILNYKDVQFEILAIEKHHIEKVKATKLS